MDDLILKAAQLAKRAHAGQLRKYNRRPYIVHPARVAARTMLLDGVTPDEVAAAWLHDVIEDCNYTAEDLLAEGFSQFAVSLVVELTNPSKQRQDLSCNDFSNRFASSFTQSVSSPAARSVSSFLVASSGHFSANA
ncbi:MAG: HD domain-containing protein [Planctomycetes bacterium]|nr:HD domain-containing protein [Planctomycetota bacterium]